MKRFLFFLLLITATLTAQAQIAETSPVRIYRVNDQIAISNVNDLAPTFYPYTSVIVGSDYGMVAVSITGRGKLYYPASLFLNSSGTPWGVSVDAALSAWKAAIPSGATIQAGNISVSASTTSTVGTVPVVQTDYTGSSGTITTTDSFKIRIINLGSASGSFTYGGLSYTLAPGDQWVITADLDPTSSKLVPFSALSVNGTGTTIRVIKSPKQ